ncbi:hypothetical protein [Coleofasciculus sp. E2-BRE-01]|uniref:hypothetical protein n=1 Tax=Coleofasciculus sp. E2-BRE-01 TaxID=3069524 RepID=UPI0032FA4475
MAAADFFVQGSIRSYIPSPIAVRWFNYNQRKFLSSRVWTPVSGLLGALNLWRIMAISAAAVSRMQFYV